MRDKRLSAAGAIFIAAFVAGFAGAGEPSDSDEPEAKPKSEYKPPPGYRTKRRGDKVVYCKKVEIPDSRLMAEKCYSEVQLRDIELLMEQQRREFDQRRRICPTPTACS